MKPADCFLILVVSLIYVYTIYGQGVTTVSPNPDALKCEDSPLCESNMTAFQEDNNDTDTSWICSLTDLYLLCPVKCKVCGECGDARVDCEFYKKRDNCQIEPMELICRKTCGYC